MNTYLVHTYIRNGRMITCLKSTEETEKAKSFLVLVEYTPVLARTRLCGIELGKYRGYNPVMLSLVRTPQGSFEAFWKGSFVPEVKMTQRLCVVLGLLVDVYPGPSRPPVISIYRSWPPPPSSPSPSSLLSLLLFFLTHRSFGM